MHLPLWFIYSFSSIAVLALAEIIQKRNIANSSLSVSTNNFVIGVFQAILGAIYVLVVTKGFIFNPTPFTITVLIVNALFSYIAFTLYYQSYKGESVGISSILFTSSVLVSAPLGILIFHESTSVFKFLGIFLVLTAIFILNISKKEKFNKYNWLALSGGLLSGFVLTTDKLLTTLVNIHTLQVVYVLTFLFVTLVFRPNTFIEAKTINPRLLKSIFIVALFYTIFNKLTLLSYTVGGEVSKVDVVNNSSIFLIIILEALILKNIGGIYKKFFCSLLVAIGFYFLTQ